MSADSTFDPFKPETEEESKPKAVEPKTEPVKIQPEPEPMVEPKLVVEAQPDVKPEKKEPEINPTVIVTKTDAYIHERMRSQPQTLDAVRATVTKLQTTASRLDLPDYFVKYSYDHTQGQGEFVFRWLFRDKRAIDYAINVRGWQLVNRRYFPDAPNHLFSANGAVEIGDDILSFVKAEIALAYRKASGDKSTERVKAQMTKHEGDPSYYKPKLDPSPGDEGYDPNRPRHQITEGADF